MDHHRPTWRMSRWRRPVGFAIAVFAFSAACSFGPSNGQQPPSARGAGGTLRVGVLLDGSDGGCSFRICGEPFDPQVNTLQSAFELAHCCLMRTLLGYNGRSVGEQGTVLQPDVASDLPTVSDDGLTWTFHLRSGLRYAPPMADTEIVAADFIRSLERVLAPSTPAARFWYPDFPLGGYFVVTYLPEVIEGAQAYVEGNADHISGLEAPDPHTMVVRLTHPTGDLGNRLAQPQLGPIPPNPARPDDPFGVAQGHDGDYGDFLVSSGPYMLEGSESMDFSRPPEDQLPPSGGGPAVVTLVRNPSWSPGIDPLRSARPDRIVIVPVPDPHAAERLLRRGAIDVMLTQPADPSQIDRWREDPALQDRLQVTPRDEYKFLNLNVAVPPLDDLHVRLAMNKAVDREALASIIGRVDVVQPFTHMALDSYEDNLLISYNPYGPGTDGNVDAAREEMRRSRYDTDDDGRCDAAACRGVVLWVGAGNDPVASSAQAAGRAIAKQLRPIGLDIVVRAVDVDTLNSGDARLRTPMRLVGWAKDYPSATTFLPVLFGGDETGVAGLNITMLGASPSALRRFGYEVRSVPSVDEQLARCERLLFAAQVRCWAELDVYLSERVAPLVPLVQIFNAWPVSARVGGFTVDAATGFPMPSLGEMSIEDPAPASLPTPASPARTSPLPEGLYRTSVTASDLARFGRIPSDAVQQSVGTFTMWVHDGWFEIHQRADHVIWDPLLIGTYSGSGHEVSFDVGAPPWNPPEGSSLRWEAGDEGSLSFTMPKCDGSAATDHIFCVIQRGLFTAHPWTAVPA